MAEEYTTLIQVLRKKLKILMVSKLPNVTSNYSCLSFKYGSLFIIRWRPIIISFKICLIHKQIVKYLTRCCIRSGDSLLTSVLFIDSKAQICLFLILYMIYRTPHEYSKTCFNSYSKIRPKLTFNLDYRLMQVTRIAECSNRAFCNIFDLH